MATPATAAPLPNLLGPDPGPTIRCSVAMLLRMGIGLGLLNSGLSSYFGLPQAGGPGGPFPGNGTTGGLVPFFGAVPYIEIGLGLALVLGFLTTASSIASGFFALAAPLAMMVQIATNGNAGPGGLFRGNPNNAMLLMLATSGASLPGLLTYSSLIWLSPLANHPFSVDALIFGRATGPELTPPADDEPVTSPPTSPVS